jgi:hypothetical protein
MSVLENAQGPSPWYLRRGNPPPLVPGFKWKAAGESGQTAGATVLAGPDGAVLILDFHNYVLLLDPGTLLVWHQPSVETGSTAPVVLRIFRLLELRPLEGDLETLCGSMRRAGVPFASSVPPLCEFLIPTDVAGPQRDLTFPEQLHTLSELLILCHSSGVEESPTGERSNLALLIARPSDGTYQLFPQDWFNFAKLDYTFQGVTHVARDARTGRIHGKGVRIEPFVLDRTLRRTLSARRLAVEDAADAVGRWLKRRGRRV